MPVSLLHSHNERHLYARANYKETVSVKHVDNNRKLTLDRSFDYDGQIFVFRDVIHEEIHVIPANFFSRLFNRYIEEARLHSLEEVRSYASRVLYRHSLSMRYEDHSISLIFRPITSWGLGKLRTHNKVGLVIDILEPGEAKMLSAKVDKIMKYFHVELAIILNIRC